MKYSYIHLVGANGVGLSAIGKLMLQQGVRVSGSDLHGGIFSDELSEMGAKIYKGHEADNLSEEVDLVLYSAAVPEDNPELEKAKLLGIPTMTYAEILGEVSKDYKTIAVAGTHGKSTTTAMLATILVDAGLDPTVIIGSRVPIWEYGNIRLGKSDIFVVEACEYRAHFLKLNPYMSVITNIDEDHLDYYKDLKHITDTFQKFVDQSEIVLINKNDKESNELDIKNKIIYSFNEYNIKLNVPGEYNLENASGALRAAIELGVSLEAALESLEKFKGIWRRFENIGDWNGATVISDYGHHPTAIKRFMKAARKKYSDRRLVHIFQPHQHSRTKELFDDFVDSLGSADINIIPEIYAVSGRMADAYVSSKELVEAIKIRKPDSEVIFSNDLEETKNILEDVVRDKDVLLFQGAGNIDDLARSLVK